MSNPRNKISTALRCYELNLPLYVRGETWTAIILDKDPGEFTIYQGEEIVSLLAEYLFGEIERGSPPRISRNTYREALKLFKLFHINAPPVYRLKPLEEEGGSVRFGRGPGKKKYGGD